MVSVHFQGKPFNIRVIQIYVPTAYVEEDEHVLEDLQDLLAPKEKKKKRWSFHHRGLEWANLIHMTIISTVDKNPLEEVE